MSLAIARGGPTSKHHPRSPGEAAMTDDKRTIPEEIELAGNQLVEEVRRLVREGNVRRLVVRGKEDRVLLEIPLNAGVAVGGVVALAAPVAAALGALAALLAEVRVEVVRETDTTAELVEPEDKG
jgi:hypothetical protein